MKIMLLRHGRTQANEERLYCGWTDVPLSPQGRNELEQMRKSCAWPNISGLRIITSGMRRADETLEILFGLAPDERMPGLREMHFGSFEMHSYEQLKADAAYQDWITDESGMFQTPGGESAAQFRSRIYEAADSIDGDALVVCHGGVIAALMARWFASEGKNMYQWQPESGRGYEVEWRNGVPIWRRIPAEIPVDA